MNNQKATKPFHDPSGVVLLHSIFPTIQGEGIFSGHPATFVRLAGCNLRCPACDTEYTNGAKSVKPEFILSEVDKVTAPNKLVVITGGEPFRQNLNGVITHLVHAGYIVQIETNGTLAPTYQTDLVPKSRVFIMCSPKTNRLHHELIPHISAYKYVIHADHINLLNGLPTRVLDLKTKGIAYPPAGNDKPVFIQPMDSKDEAVNFRHLNATMRSALNHGYTLCLQIHKIINVE